MSSFIIPELHRLYHNSQIDAAGSRFTKASEQVVDAIFCAHPVTKKIVDELEPIVDEHLIKSTAALDGGVEAVDLIITKAVEVALKPFAESLYAEQDQSQSTESQHTESYSSKSTTTPSTEKTTDSSDKTVATADFLAGLKKKKESSDFDYRFDHPFTMALSFEPLPQKKEDEVKGGEGEDHEEEEGAEEAGEEEEGEGAGEEEEEGEREFEKEDLKTEYEESSLTVADSKAFDEAGEYEDEQGEEEEEEQTSPPVLRFYVTDDVVRSLAAKSVQVEYDTELGQQVWFHTH